MVSGPDERTRIRAALIDLCFERGYRQIGLADLLARAAVTEREFHRHFADLEDCFCRVYLEIRDGFLDRVAVAVSDEESWRDRIRATAYVLIRFLAEDEKVTHLSSVDVLTAGERAHLLFGEAVERLTTLIDEGRGERESSTGETISRATAGAIAGGILTQIYATSGQKAPMPPEGEVVPQMMYTAVLPYLGEEAAREELSIPPPPSP
jgi:AcrR family transcriptional regulator